MQAITAVYFIHEKIIIQLMYVTRGKLVHDCIQPVYVTGGELYATLGNQYSASVCHTR